MTRDAAPKAVVWLHGEIKTPPFSKEARVEAGALLRRLQEGESLGMPHSRPMPSIGSRCHELRVRDEDHNWRIVYRIDPDAIVIADVFAKTTRETPKHVIDACQRRLKRHDEACWGADQIEEVAMDEEKRKRLEAAGFRVGDAADFLELTDEERSMVEARLAASRAIRRAREKLGLTQQQLAEKLNSSQSRVAKIEAGASDVSLDLLVRALFAVGGRVQIVDGDDQPRKPSAKKRRRAVKRTRVKALNP